MPCQRVTIPGASIKNVSVTSYKVPTGVNSATPKLTVSNPNSVSVKFTSKVTVNGSEPSSSSRKTITIPANSTGSVSYSLSFNVAAGASKTPTVCIVPVSTST